MNFPNKITPKDFEGWIQERGLYFASQWDGKYETVISCHDPGEPDKKGGLLYARYGKGVFIYTGYAWFRQLPAGVPGGATALIANIGSEKIKALGWMYVVSPVLTGVLILLVTGLIFNNMPRDRNYPYKT